MATIKFFKMNALPGTLEPDSVYFILNGSIAETWVTNSTGVAKQVGNTDMLEDFTQIIDGGTF